PHSIPYKVRPNEFDDTGVVIAIRQVVVERGEAVLLTGLFHLRQVRGVELVPADVAPIVGRGIHGETGRDGAIGADDHVVLTSPATPFGKVQLAIFTLYDSRRLLQQLRDIAVGRGSIAVPSET